MHRSVTVIPTLVVTVLVLSGCANADSAAPSPSAIRVVASTNVWGDIAAKVGGDEVDVTSIIDDPSKDPHEYEANAQNQLALTKAQVVVANGGGYDDFVGTMLKASKNEKVTTLDAVKISGKKAEGGGELNEHVWYDFPTVEKVIDQLEKTYTAIDSAHAATFTKNADALRSELAVLEKQENTLKASHAGEGVAITEPVPLYMLDAIGLDNKTPEKFSEAIEEDTDVSAPVLQQTLALFTSRQVALLAYNEQTTGPQTEAVLTAAEDSDVAVVPVTETLPAGHDYIGWMTDNVNAIATALAK